MRHALLLAALLSTAGHAAEPASLFGVTIGQPLPMAQCPPNTHVAKGAPCWTERTANLVSVLYPQSMAVVGQWEMSVRLVDGVPQRMWVWTTGQTSQQRILDGLTEKFGPPAALSEVPKGNRYGARIDSIQAVWELPGGVTLTLNGVADRASRGQVLMTTPQGEAANRAAFEAIERGQAKTPL